MDVNKDRRKMFVTTSAESFIRSNLVWRPVPDLPGISLWQTGPASRLSSLYDNLTGDGPAPFWAFVWGGGMGLARYIHDHGDQFEGQRVYDVGTGSGLVAIAAAQAGASCVTACDIDMYACEATRLNAQANNVDLTVQRGNACSQPVPDTDILTVGDLFYDADTAKALLPWLEACLALGIRILIGDPGRAYLPASRLKKLAMYPGYDFAREDQASSPNAVFELMD